MKRNDLQEQQTDLFANAPTPPGLTTLRHQRDELVVLISRLLWEVAQGSSTTASASKEIGHEQDQH